MSDGWYLIDLDRAETFVFGWDSWILHNRIDCSSIGTWIVESAATGDTELWDFTWNDKTMLGDYGLHREVVPKLWDWIRAAPAKHTFPLPTRWSDDMCFPDKSMRLTVCHGIIIMSGLDFTWDICLHTLPKWREVGSIWMPHDGQWHFSTKEAEVEYAKTERCKANGHA